MTEEKIENLKAELDALGNYWRMDWSEFDGRTLQYQLSLITEFIDSDAESHSTFRTILKDKRKELGLD